MSGAISNILNIIKMASGTVKLVIVGGLAVVVLGGFMFGPGLFSWLNPTRYFAMSDLEKVVMSSKLHSVEFIYNGALQLCGGGRRGHAGFR